MTHLGQRLRADHLDIDALCDDIANRAACGDWAVLDAVWTQLDATLRQHLSLEEQFLFPRFAVTSPDETEALRDEHDALRRRLAELGIAIEVRALREEAAREFVAMVGAHAARENALFYPWVDEMPIRRILRTRRARARGSTGVKAPVRQLPRRCLRCRPETCHRGRRLS